VAACLFAYAEYSKLHLSNVRNVSRSALSTDGRRNQPDAKLGRLYCRVVDHLNSRVQQARPKRFSAYHMLVHLCRTSGSPAFRHSAATLKLLRNRLKLDGTVSPVSTLQNPQHSQPLHTPVRLQPCEGQATKLRDNCAPCSAVKLRLKNVPMLARCTDTPHC
jgi:hypothetical protein